MWITKQLIDQGYKLLAILIPANAIAGWAERSETQ